MANSVSDIAVHQKYMQRALQLAALGLGKVSPNPMVGAVVVHPEKGIIGEGYHQVYGGPHAEVNAIAQIADAGLLSEATIYVTLEPCSHFGKTPPCANLIIEQGIKKVVIALQDPNPLVAGRGIALLQQAGIEVISGVLEQEAILLNKTFLHHIRTGMPYVYLKWAQSTDGFLAPAGGKPVLISNEVHQMQVHKQRAEVDAILVGYNTVVNDNPALTVRHWSGRNPQRIVVDPQLALPHTYQIFGGEETVWIINSQKTDTTNRIKYLKITHWDTPTEMLELLSKNGIGSLVVEGGAKTLAWFLNGNHYQEKWVYTHPNLYFANGIAIPYSGK
jgi:diaminohydroxyphosphoribosylaminopyrimidine deaminase/5-amino-6-(5-phosphoribosylamino)uracil reductase